MTEKKTVSVPIPVVYSRYCPGLKNAEDVGLQKGDKVTFDCGKDQLVECTLQSDRTVHDGAKPGDSLVWGYEALFSDDGKTYFVDEKRIINWEGKC